MLRHFSKTSSAGFTIIELMVVVAVMSILSAIALPSYNAWMKSIQIRNAAESMLNGLQKARAEAVARNARVKFTLGAASTWTVSCVTVTATCPSPIESRAAAEGSKDVTVTAVATDNSAVTTATYNNLGLLIDAKPLSKVTFSLTGGGKNMQVSIGAGGNAKMCDPTLASGSSSRAC
jgi:type IV fimbrial biogenesis protein FimT